MIYRARKACIPLSLRAVITSLKGCPTAGQGFVSPQCDVFRLHLAKLPDRGLASCGAAVVLWLPRLITGSLRYYISIHHVHNSTTRHKLFRGGNISICGPCIVAAAKTWARATGHQLALLLMRPLTAATLVYGAIPGPQIANSRVYVGPDSLKTRRGALQR